MNHRSTLGLLAGAVATLSAGTASPQVTGNDAIMVVNWQWNNTTTVFVQTLAGDLVSSYSQPPSLSDGGTTDTWTPLTTVAKGATCGATAAYLTVEQTGEVYAAAPSGGAQRTHGNAGASSSWSAFQPIGGDGGDSSQLSHLSALVWADTGTGGATVERQIFALGIDHDIQTLTLGLHTSVVSPWATVGNSPANLVTGSGVLLWPDAHAEIFATDASGTVWHLWTNGADATSFGKNVSKIPATTPIASRPVPVLPSNGVPQVIARGTDQQLYVSTFASSAFQPFSVTSAGTLLQGEPSAIATTSGGIEVFARNTDGIVVHLEPNATSFTSFFDQAAASDPFASVRSDGTVNVFVIDPSGVLQHSFRPASGTWSAWTPIGGVGLNPCVLLPPPSPDAGTDATGTGGAGPSPTGNGGLGGGGHGGAASAGGAGGATGTDDGTGCGCRAAARDDAGTAWLAAAALGLIARRRRRAAPAT